MEVKAQVGIISIFGRGHWLAAALAQAQVPVTLLDVSSQMGPWDPEDTEGPFGFFEATDSQKERLSADEKLQLLERGLTLWLKSGPLELRGPTTEYRLGQMGIPSTVIEYLQNAGKKDFENLKALPFRENWLAHLAHGLTSTVDTLSPEAGREGLKRSVLAPFFIRKAGPSQFQGLEKSLRWCEDKGVTVLRQVEVKDLAFLEKNTLDSLEIRRDKPGLFKAEQFVICLTAEECGMLSHKMQNSLFGGQVQEPEWAWLRYRVQFKGLGEDAMLTLRQLPEHCVVIEDLMLPWAHENFLILQRGSVNLFDAWMKIPHNQRFHSQYLQERGQQMKSLLEARLPECTVDILSLPKEAGSTFQQLGPTRNPIFSRALRAWRKNFVKGNVAFDSPEFWRALSWEGQMDHQEKIFQSLKTWWDRKEELRVKREAKEAAKRKNRGADL